MNKEYKNETYKDAGVEKGFTTKALITVLALILAFALTLSSCGSVADAGSSDVTTTAAALDNAVSKSEMFTERDLSKRRLSLSAAIPQRHRLHPESA